MRWNWHLSAILLSGAAPALARAQSVDLTWHTFDGGGGMFTTGSTFELSGTIGQPDAGSPAVPLTGGPFELVGGFWPIASTPISCPGDTNADGIVDLTDLAALLANFGTPAGATAAGGDMDGDGDVELGDLTALLSRFGTICP